MRILLTIRKSIHGLLTEPLEELSRAQRTLRYMLDFGRYCAMELRVDRAGEMAAALTYHTLFSLLPMMVVMLAILQNFASVEHREQLKQDVIDFTLQWVVGEEDASEATDKVEITESQVSEPGPFVKTHSDDPPTTETREESYANFRNNLEGHAQNLFDWLENINFKSIGAVGVLLFFYAATKLLTTIEHSFNRIYDAPFGRPLQTRFTLYFTSIVLAPLVLLAGQYAQAWVIDVIEKAAAVTGQSVGWLGEFTALATPFVTTWLLVSLMYKLLPNTHVKARAAATGGFVAAVAWIVVVECFKIYVDNAGTASLYGALALPLLFLFWLWVTWLIVLFGLEVTYTIQAMDGRRFKSLRTAEDRDVLFDPRWMIPLVAMIGKEFEAGKPVRFNELQSATGLPNRAVASLIDLLTKANVIHHVEHGEPGVPAYTLARPPERIGVDELLDISGKTAMRERGRFRLAGTDLVAQLHAAQINAAKGTTLADVMGQDAK